MPTPQIDWYKKRTPSDPRPSIPLAPFHNRICSIHSEQCLKIKTKLWLFQHTLLLNGRKTASIQLLILVESAFKFHVTTVADLGFPGGEAPTPGGAPTYYLVTFSPNTAWKWKNLRRRELGRVPCAPWIRHCTATKGVFANRWYLVLGLPVPGRRTFIIRHIAASHIGRYGMANCMYVSVCVPEIVKSI